MPKLLIMDFKTTIFKRELVNASTNLLNDVYILYKIRGLHCMVLKLKLLDKIETATISKNLKELQYLSNPYDSNKKLVNIYTYDLIIQHYNTLYSYIERK